MTYLRAQNTSLSKHLLVVALGILLYSACAPALSAQSIGDFRSRSSGRWNKSNSWEEYTANGWKNTNNDPDYQSGAILIQDGHVIQANDGGTYDELTIEFGGELRITKDFEIVNGPGTDLIVFGRILVNKPLVFLNGASAIFKTSSVVDINKGDEITFQGASSAVFESGAEVNNKGLFELSNTADVTLNAGTVFNNSNTIDLGGNAQLTINGTLNNSDTVEAGNSSQIIFGSTSVYVHDQNGGDFPTANRTTWSTGSTALITGITRNLPGELDNDFANLTWNSTSQNRHVDLDAEIGSISGDLTIASTGSKTLLWKDSGAPLTIGGDYIQTGGEFIFTETGSSTFSVGGDFNLMAGTTTLSESSGSPILQVEGNFNVTSTLIQGGSSYATIELSGNGPQEISTSGSLSGNFNMALSGSGQKTLSTDLTLSGSLIETSGGLDVAGNTLTISGSLLIDTAFQNAGQVIMNGTGNTELSLPAASNTIPDLVIEVGSGTLTLLSDIIVSEMLTIHGGTIVENGFQIDLLPGAVMYSDVPVTGNITMSRTYSWNEDGWRMIASPVSGVETSSLNAAFWTQGGAWAGTTTGTSNLHSFNFSGQDWSPVTGASSNFAAGSAYILYVYKNNNVGTPVLPTTWTVQGGAHNITDIPLAYSGVTSSSYNYVGNPLTTNLDWSESQAASTNVSPTYATWDPSMTTGGGTTGYKYYNAASGTGAAGRYIAPFTGFMVSTSGNSPSLAVRTSEAASRGTANYFGKRGNSAPHIRLLVEGNGLAEDETYLTFGPEASRDDDPFDVVRINPLSQHFVTIWSVSTPNRLAFDGRNMQSGREVYDFAFAATAAGSYRIRVSDLFEIPEHWNITLIDLASGKTHDLGSGNAASISTRDQDVLSVKKKLSSIESPRFRIVVEDPSKATEEPLDSFSNVGEVVLAQNYPNPFNPSTSIRFSLPESSPVKLEVYDALGRRIHTLVNKSLDAGWHEVSWQAQDLSSGMYFYRLTHGSQVLTRSMLLLR